MGVDYAGHYGIGVKLIEEDFEELDMDGIESMEEYIEALPESDKVKTEWFEVGNNYTNRGRVYYLCIANAMSDGVEELVRKVGLFEVYLRENKVRYEGKVDCVGGLEVY